jgi:DNA-binding transcriptional regulator YhcF (GntR family)
MQLWFSRHSHISIREQLATQVVLAIVSGELSPGQRLPSTRELARRFHLHPNTISAGYRQLERNNWLEFRKGSGVYVRAETNPAENGLALDQLIADFFHSARQLNAPLAVVRSRLKQWLEMQPPDHFRLIERDVELARIIEHEMRAALTFPVKVTIDFASEPAPVRAIPVALSISEQAARTVLPANSELLVLHLRSAQESLARHLPARINVLVGIVSAWLPFLKNARAMLISAGFHPDSLLVRDRAKPAWHRGLGEAAAIVCDSLTATTLTSHPRILSFPLLAQRSVDELRNYEQFVRDPLSA